MLLDGVQMVNILLLEHLVCSKYVIRQDGLTLSAKLRVDLLRNWCGHRMVLCVQVHVEVEM